MSKSKRELEIPILADLGTGGYKRYGGIINDEWHPELQGTTRAKVFRQMLDNDPMISGGFALMAFLLRQVSWKIDVDPEKEGTPLHRYWADFAESCREDMKSPWGEILMSAFSFLPWGYALMWESWKIRRGNRSEKLFNSRYNDGLFGWKDLQIRAQATIREWHFDEDSDPIGATQWPEDGTQTVDLALDRMLHLRLWPERGNPEGRAMLRPIYRPWHFKTRLEEIEAVGFLRDLNGYPVIKVPPAVMAAKATTEAAAVRSAMEQNVRRIRRDELEGMVFPNDLDREGKPTGYNIELLSGSGRGFGDINNAIMRHRAEIAIALMTEIQLMGLNAVGTQALSTDKREILEVALGAILDTFCEAFNRQTLRRLMLANRVPQEYWPILTHGDVDTPDVVAIVDAFGRAVQTGLVIPTDQDERNARDMLDWPQREATDTPMPVSQMSDGDALLGMATDAAQHVKEMAPPVEKEEEKPKTFLAEGPFIDDVTAAETLGVPLNSVRRAVRNGKLPGNKVGRNYRIHRDDVEQFFRRNLI